MTKRGKILRDTSAGNGLVVIEGQQYPFMLEGTWRSEVPPAVGMTVDAEINDAGQIVSLLVVQDSQLTKEQAQAALLAAKGKGAEMFSGLVARVGAVNLVALLVLIIGWIFLNAVSIQSPMGGNMSFTFWQLLGFINAKNALDVAMQAGTGSASTGIYGLLAFVCLLGPFVRYFWKDKLAVLGGVLPLLFMLIVGLIAHSSLSPAAALGGTGIDPNDPMVKEMTKQVSQAISIGAGVYLSVLACLYFAGIGVKDFLAAKTGAAPKAF
ncbi:MAG: hypothetical protein P4K93_00225 [Terracidiphilus sp.]|nr:hypothetical protein [Terracidiphilus sp.]MDR3796543.1 hypothetical protein [Terracidiphilus sp.]